MEAIYENHNFLSVCEFLPNYLYFVTVQKINNGGSCDAIIPNTDDIHFFTTDNELVYHNFYGDFGPLGVTSLYKFCKKLTNKLATYAGDAFYEKFITSRFGRKDIVEKLQEKFLRKKVIIYYTSTNNEKRANAAYLISAFAVLYLGFSPRMAHKALLPSKLRYRPFQDASVGLSQYKINMKDCLDALHKASIFGFFNFNDFNVSECSYYENIEHGDMNWVIPQKFLAFPGPVEEKNDYYHHPHFYVEYFLVNNVTDIVRLNQRAYDPKCFTMFGMKHHDLYMEDGSDPPEMILKKFMGIAENAEGAIAVHCKAGLGRTGSLIGAYLLKHYRMTAKEAIAWIRICRPGSVIGHQQAWLEAHEEFLWWEGNEWRMKVYGKTEIVPSLPFGIYSFESPKKEFSGLKDLLNTLNRRSKYRFLAKNRASKRSKAGIQQMIRNILQTARIVAKEKEMIGDKQSADQKGGFAAEQTVYKGTDSKSLEYLKAPPQPDSSYYYPNECTEHSQPQQQVPHLQQPQRTHTQPSPQPQMRHRYHPQNQYQQQHPPGSAYQQRSNEYTAPCMHANTSTATATARQQAMYSQPSSYYSTYPDSDYSQSTCPERGTYMNTNMQKANRPPDIQKAFSTNVAPKTNKSKPHNIVSKSVDKNWKNSHAAGMSNYYGNYRNHTRRNVVEENYMKNDDNICAFDSRIDTISQYSRFTKPMFNKSCSEKARTTTPENDFFIKEPRIEPRLKPRYECPKTSYVVPSQNRSWSESYDKAGNKKTQGDHLNEIKRAK